jgi:hypothetical protein
MNEKEQYKRRFIRSKKVFQNLDIPRQKLVSPLIARAPNIAGRKSGISSLITSDMTHPVNIWLYAIACYTKKICV